MLDFLSRNIFFTKKFYLSGKIAVRLIATRRGGEPLCLIVKTTPT